MEGARRVAPRVGALLIALAIAMAAGGCDSSAESGSGTVATEDPATAFAPLVRFDGRERWLPMSVDDFLHESVLWFAEDHGCADRKIAVGRGLEEQRTERYEWIVPLGLGKGPAYYRTPYDASCDYDYDAGDYFANQRTRPYDTSERPTGLGIGEGYYLDLVDRARRPARPLAEAYYERLAATVRGQAGLRLTYWLLHGMSQPLDPGGDPIERLSHEGDWERVDVVVRGGDGEFEPVAIRLERHGVERAIPWQAVEHVSGDDSDDETHPVVLSTRGAHALTAAREPDACDGCRQWPTWERLADARRQPWYGFGGAWGELGRDLATTGPIGPHGEWARGR